MISLPNLPSIAEIRRRLEAIFPDGMANRLYLTREIAARVVFVMLYIGAVEKLGRWLGPKHVYRMSDEQAKRRGERERLLYGEKGWRPGFKPRGKRWYEDTTREPIRDETLRFGLIVVGAAIQRTDIATTSGLPRYALRDDFAELFDPSLQGDPLAVAVAEWQSKHLDPLALARIELLRQGMAAASAEGVEVVLPNRSIRRLSPGPSSVIAKAVVEAFAPRFLYEPAVLLLSESGEKIVAQDERTTSKIGLKLDKALLLPDLILFDLEPGKELLVFVEVVATDGPVTESRKESLLKFAEGTRIAPQRIAFVTAYSDRSAPSFRKTFGTVAWNTLVWLMAEPDRIVVLRDRPALAKRRIFDLLYEGS